MLSEEQLWFSLYLIKVKLSRIKCHIKGPWRWDGVRVGRIIVPIVLLFECLKL